MTTTRKTTQQLLDAIARDRVRLEKALRVIGDGASTTPVTVEGWTTKDVFSHLIHWTSQIAFGLGAKLTPPSYLLDAKDRRLSGDEWNARAVEHWRDQPFDQVKAEFDRVVDALIEQVRKRNDDQMNANDALPWAGARPLWQQIERETTEHWAEHADALVLAARGAA